MSRIALDDPVLLSTNPAAFARNWEARLCTRGTEVLVDVYDAETGGAKLAQPLITDAGGRPRGADGEVAWVEEGSYDLRISPALVDNPIQVVHIEAAKGGSIISGLDVLLYKGALDCSANPNYPAADAGHTYVVSVGGKIGGAAGLEVEPGDTLLCKVDGSAAGTQAAVGADWNALQANLVNPVVKSLVDAKGDLIAGTADNAVTRLGVGANGTVLTADSAQASGLKWAAPGGGAKAYVQKTEPAVENGATWYKLNEAERVIAVYACIAGVWTKVVDTTDEVDAHDYRTIAEQSARFANAAIAAHYMFTLGATMAANNSAVGAGSQWVPIIYLRSADFPERAGYTPKLSLRFLLAINQTAPAVTFKAGLYPVTVNGAANNLGYVIGGERVAGSTVEWINPAASASGGSAPLMKETGDFALPADGAYVLGCQLTGTLAANSSVGIMGTLRRRYA